MYRIRIKLSRLLGELHLTQADLADMADMREGTLSEYVREITDRVSLVYIARICEALECDLTDIFELESSEAALDNNERWSRIQAKKEAVRAKRRQKHQAKRRQ